MCKYCNEAIRDADGFVFVDPQELEKAEQAAEHRRQRGRTVNYGLRSEQEIEDDHTVAGWYATHHACAEPNDDAQYSIHIGDISEPVGLLRRTAHLIQKPWVTGMTSWSGLIYHYVGAHDGQSPYYRPD
jgi:hypothetical protein